MPQAQPFKIRERIRLPDLKSEQSNFVGDYPNHTWTFWASPTPKILAGLLYVWSLRERKDGGEEIPAEQSQQATQDYLLAVSELVIDTGESNLDLSTPALVQDALEINNHAEIVVNIISDYTRLLLNRRADAEKKAAARSARSNGSGVKSDAGSASPIATGAL